MMTATSTEELVDQIIIGEAEADERDARTSELRWSLAEKYAEALKTMSQRELAAKVRKSAMHVNRMNQVWQTFGVTLGLRDRPPFNEAYQQVKRGKPKSLPDPDPPEPVDDNPPETHEVPQPGGELPSDLWTCPGCRSDHDIRRAQCNQCYTWELDENDAPVKIPDHERPATDQPVPPQPPTPKSPPQHREHEVAPDPTDDLPEWHGPPQTESDREHLRMGELTDYLIGEVYSAETNDVYKTDAHLSVKTAENLEFAAEVFIRIAKKLRSYHNV